ncbi:MAG: NUDIX domain-containing protein [Myxococcales bacterium]|nr:NUDIX domain-containing protein [Myxococcales bacterium]
MRRVVATVVLVVHDARALVLRRRPDDRSFAHAWCLPGGGVDADDLSIPQAALRETLEETGLPALLVRDLGVHTTALSERQIVFDIHRFVGRALHDQVRLSEEHVAHRWLSRRGAAAAHLELPGGLAGEATRDLLDRFALGDLP